ncbi:MAG: hypothetical protein NT013_11940 [Planctomycetia bacterium]|nr:hypothetical protein [Planctomycetia bacterium]
MKPFLDSTRDRRASVSRGIVLLLGLFIVTLLNDVASAQSKGAVNNKEKGADKVKSKKPTSDEPNRPRDYRSANFLLHTDLPKDEADELLKRLETMISLISKYWGRPNKQPLECFVVRDLSVWPQGAFPPEGLAKIEEGAGVTLTQTRVLRGTGEIVGAKATVYAVANRGIPQHEAVHAYCGQNFGHTGPIWYSEGMAEMGQYWKAGESRVNCHPEAVRYIRSSEPKSLNAIVNAREITGDSWENYCWRWALCHLLANNPNYYDRFRPLGLGLLMDKSDATFENVYGSMSKEISFEYLFFLQHFDLGYEVTLTAWDWKTKFRRATSSVPVTCTIEANHGWQASRLLVKVDEEFELTAEGAWQLSDDGPLLNPFGEEVETPKPTNVGAAVSKATKPKKTGSKTESKQEALPTMVPYQSNFTPGQLVGVLFNDYELGEPFAIPSNGNFKAPADGQLFLRCEESWNKLADNKGKVNLKIRSRDTN